MNNRIIQVKEEKRATSRCTGVKCSSKTRLFLLKLENPFSIKADKEFILQKGRGTLIDQTESKNSIHRI